MEVVSVKVFSVQLILDSAAFSRREVAPLVNPVPVTVRVLVPLVATAVGETAVTVTTAKTSVALVRVS